MTEHHGYEQPGYHVEQVMLMHEERGYADQYKPPQEDDLGQPWPWPIQYREQDQRTEYYVQRGDHVVW